MNIQAHYMTVLYFNVQHGPAWRARCFFFFLGGTWWTNCANFGAPSLKDTG